MSANDSIRGFSGQFDSVVGRVGRVFTRVARSIGLVALLCFLLPGSLLATDWTLTATFTDGGTANGSFTINSDNTVTAWNIVVSSYSNYSIPAFTYTPQNSSANYNTDGGSNCTGPCLQFISTQTFSDNGSPPSNNNLALNLSFLAPLIGPGTVGMYVRDTSDEPSNECLDCSQVDNYRLFSSGSATTSNPLHQSATSLQELRRTYSMKTVLSFQSQAACPRLWRTGSASARHMTWPATPRVTSSLRRGVSCQGTAQQAARSPRLHRRRKSHTLGPSRSTPPVTTSWLTRTTTRS